MKTKGNETRSTHIKDAKLALKLRAASGYCSDQEHVISADQWQRICAILYETE
jgi:Zn finger protein HypA/HybF involved in hydrogenase expression